MGSVSPISQKAMDRLAVRPVRLEPEVERAEASRCLPLAGRPSGTPDGRGRCPRVVSRDA